MAHARLFTSSLASLLVGHALAACSPTVKIQVPDKPIEINMNIKIEQEVRIRVEREVDELAKSNPGIF